MVRFYHLACHLLPKCQILEGFIRHDHIHTPTSTFYPFLLSIQRPCIHLFPRLFTLFQEGLTRRRREDGVRNRECMTIIPERGIRCESDLDSDITALHYTNDRENKD